MQAMKAHPASENLSHSGSAEQGLCRYMKEAFRRHSHSGEAEREPPAVSGYLLLAWKGGGRRDKVSGQMKNKLSKICCSTSKQKLSKFKLQDLSSISFSLVIYYREENEKPVLNSGLNITLKQN